MVVKPHRRPIMFKRLPKKKMTTVLDKFKSDYLTGQIIYVDGGWLACL